MTSTATCGMTLRTLRLVARPSSVIAFPSMRIPPAAGSRIRKSARISVDFPDPVRPMMADFW